MTEYQMARIHQVRAAREAIPSNKELARELNLSVIAIKSHIRRRRQRRLDAASRAVRIEG